MTPAEWAERGPPTFPPPWASAWGDDAYGLWADLVVSGFTQRLRWIEPGEFWMGSPEDEAERFEDEGPRHRVLLTQGYWLSDSACTQALWQAVMGNNPSNFKKGEEAPQRPVEKVSWDEVQDFLARLQLRLAGDAEGEYAADRPAGIRPTLLATLPTEAEWEYACRAGTQTPFSFGADITTEQANYNGNNPYAGGKKGQFRKTTVPVKRLPANPWGLYEMHGNVYEWCADNQMQYEGRPETDPQGAKGESVARRVARGGSWDNVAGRMRSADRGLFQRDIRSSELGFRFAQPTSTHPARSPDGMQWNPGPLARACLPGWPGATFPDSAALHPGYAGSGFAAGDLANTQSCATLPAVFIRQGNNHVHHRQFHRFRRPRSAQARQGGGGEGGDLDQCLVQCRVAASGGNLRGGGGGRQSEFSGFAGFLAGTRG
ncbi:MAG: formylglycine-generating enzyme family protein [Pseudomonadota bacterium]|nr:formylglycine-generating enzyme family protein [Pseudomonadota bacterium]